MATTQPKDPINAEVISLLIVIIGGTCHEVLHRYSKQYRNIRRFQATLRERLDEVCSNRLSDNPREQDGLRSLVADLLRVIEQREENVEWHEKGCPTR